MSATVAMSGKHRPVALLKGSSTSYSHVQVLSVSNIQAYPSLTSSFFMSFFSLVQGIIHHHPFVASVTDIQSVGYCAEAQAGWVS